MRTGGFHTIEQGILPLFHIADHGFGVFHTLRVILHTGVGEVIYRQNVKAFDANGNELDVNTVGEYPHFLTEVGIHTITLEARDSFGNYKREEFEIASFSSRGPAGYFFKPDVIAPAVNITGASNKKDSFYLFDIY